MKKSAKEEEMGFCESKPLQIVSGSSKKGEKDESTSSTANKLTSRKSSKISRSQFSAGNNSSSNFFGQESDLPRQYFSFKAFILQNESPQIFDWLFTKEICKCSTSQIYLVKNVESQLLFAAKVYNNEILHKETSGDEDPPIDRLNREIKIMSSITHPNVMSFHEMIDDIPTNSTILILPYAPLGSLDDLPIDSPVLLHENLLVCMYQIADGMAFMHSKNVTHRDLKPRNILAFSNSYFCVTSFSLSTALDDENEVHDDLKGTTEYLSPEEVSGNPYKLKKTDIWAFAVTFYYLFFKTLPFEIGEITKNGTSLTAPMMKGILKNNELSFPKSPEVDQSIKDVFSKILRKDPEKRPNFSDITGYDIFERAREIQRTEIYPEWGTQNCDGVDSIVYESSTISQKKESL